MTNIWEALLHFRGRRLSVCYLLHGSCFRFALVGHNVILAGPLRWE
jgi:hypothetical protein